MKTAFALIFWTFLGAVSLKIAFAGLPLGWIGIVITAFGIKQALWPRDRSKNSSDMDIGSCFGDGCGGGCGGCGD